MKKLIGIVLLVIILTGCSVSTNQANHQPTVTPKEKSAITETQIEELIKKLGDDDWQTREKAQQELIKMGKEIKPVLEKHVNNSDPEIKSRIIRILNEFNPVVVVHVCPTESAGALYRTYKEYIQSLRQCMEKVNEVIVLEVSDDTLPKVMIDRPYFKVVLRMKKSPEMVEKINQTLTDNGFMLQSIEK